MKKLLFLLLITAVSYGQTYQNPTFGTVTTKTSPTVTNDPYITTAGTTGIQGKIAPVNLIIPHTPVNYTVPNLTIGAHLSGIDTRLGQISSTTAGLTQRIYFTADDITVNSVIYFASNSTGKGATAAGSPPALVLADNTKGYFTKDLISIPQPAATIGYAGSYSGNLTVSATPTPVATRQRFTVEVYRTNNLGTPIASGVSGAPVGDLGVTVIAVLDSGELNINAGAITNVAVNGILTQNITINTGERLRYHVSAAKIGAGGGNVTFQVYYGSSYNSYYDVPVAITTDAVVNKSTVVGVTDTDALNTLNTGKENISNSLKSYSSNKKVVPLSKKAVFSFIWDDIQTSDLSVYNVFQEYGYVPNYALVTSNLNSGNKDLYIDFYKKGCSILAHSVTHPNMSGTTLTNAQVNAEMVNSKNAIEAYGIRVSGWVTPSSSLNPIYYPQMDKNFGYGFVYPSLTGAFNQTVDKLRLSRVSLEEAMYGHNLANVKAIIDDAIANNKLITFYAHSLPSTYLNVDLTPSLTEADLRDILAYLKTKTDENLCSVMSTDESIKMYYDNSIITEDGTSVNIGGKFRVNASENNPYSAAFSTSAIGNLTSINNGINLDNTTAMNVYTANRLGGINASVYLGVLNNSTDHQSIFVFGRKIDATNWKESFRIGVTGNFMLNSATDDGARLSINDATAGNSLRINRGTGGVLFASDNNLDAIAIYNKAGTTLYQKWNSDGTSTFGSGITATTYSGGATLTGDPKAPTAAVGDNDTSIATTAFVFNNARPYKVYTALISQSGTSAPTATVLENTLGGTVVWTRSGVGQYVGTLSGVFTSAKTFVLTGNMGGNTGNYYGGSSPTTSTISVTSNNNLGSPADTILAGAPIEIRVYN